MVGPIAPPTVVVDQQTKSTAPVVNQPVVAPAVVNHIAPAVAINNVARERWGDCKKEAVYIGAVSGEGVTGIGCVVGTTFGAVEIAGKMGATVAVSTGIGWGVALLGALCTVGSVVATGVHYCATDRKRVAEADWKERRETW